MTELREGTHRCPDLLQRAAPSSRIHPRRAMLWDFSGVCPWANGAREDDNPRSQASPWDRLTSGILGFTQDRGQEWAVGKWKKVSLREDTDSTNRVRPSQEAREAPGHGAGSFIGLGNFIGQCVGGVLKLFGGRGRDFTFDPLWSALELSWQLRVCH